MAEPAEKENINDPEIDDPINQEPQDDPQDELPKPSEAEEHALKLGWKPRDEWEGDPDDWTSAKRFNQTRDIIDSNKSLRSQQDRMQHDFSERLENNKKLNQQMLDLKVDELKSKRDSAAADADMDTYNEANKQLDNLEKSPEPQTVSPQNMMAGIVNHPVTQTFIAENEWIKEQTPKGIYGQKIFTDWISANQNNPNAILEDGLKLVKQSVNQAFPQNNPNRNNVQPMGDRGNGPRKTAPRNRLTLDDLTRAEQNIYDAMGSTWKSEKDFLQAVADNRKGE